MACATYYNESTKIWTGPEEKFDTTSKSIGEVLLSRLQEQGDKVVQVRLLFIQNVDNFLLKKIFF